MVLRKTMNIKGNFTIISLMEKVSTNLKMGFKIINFFLKFRFVYSGQFINDMLHGQGELIFNNKEGKNTVNWMNNQQFGKEDQVY